MNHLRRLTGGTLITLILSTSVAAGVNQALPKDFDKAKYPRIGYLVCRMGVTKLGLIDPITPDLDFAYRPASGKSRSGQKNFLIDDEQRLREAVPEYPLSGTSSTPKARRNYYRNLTVPIIGELQTMLTRKGYQAIDVRQAAAGWDTPWSEMTVRAIGERLRGTVDALLVLNYIDAGEYRYETPMIDRIEQGFSHLYFASLLLDIQTGRVLLANAQTMGIAVTDAIASDPEVQADPEKRKRVEELKDVSRDFPITQGYYAKERKNLLIKCESAVIIRLPEEEVLQLVLKYLLRGSKQKYGDVPGLETLIP